MKNSRRMKAPKCTWSWPLVAGAIVALVCAMPATAATEAEVQTAVDDGVAWLVSVQDADGYWTGGGDAVGNTGLACTKLMDYATDPERGLGLPSPFDVTYIYRDNVVRCVNWLLDRADNSAIAVQPAGDPDTNGNSQGVSMSSQTYENAIGLMTLCNTVDLGRTAPASSPQAGRTYLDIAHDMADNLYYCQNEPGVWRGGWRYGCNSSSDESVAGWVGFGFWFSAAAPPDGCGLAVPQFVLDELALWIDYIQGDVTGCAGYTAPDNWTNVLKQGHLLQHLALLGFASDSAEVQAAEACLCSVYDNGDANVGWDGGAASASYQATYTAAKGLLAYGDDLKLICDPDKDWCADFDDEIVNEQNADGSWSSCIWGNPVLCTSWALLTLERAVPPPPGIDADIDIKFCSNPNGFNCKGRGIMPMTVFGSAELDVSEIDLDTVQLCLADDDTICIDVDSLENWQVEDRGDPTTDIGANMCAINPDTGEQERFLNQDLIMDLELRWNKRDVVDDLFDGCDGFDKKEASPTLIFKATTLGGVAIMSTPLDDPGVDQVWRQK